MVTAGGEAGKNQTVPGQGGQGSLRDMQDHANRRGDRADAFAKQLRELEAAEAQEFRPLFDTLGREFREGDGRRIASSFAADRMAESIPLVRTFDARAKREFVEKLHRSLPEYFDLHAAAMAWSSLEIQTQSAGPPTMRPSIATRMVNAGGET